MHTHKGITLIGMSNAGKTTVGPLLGYKMGWPVYDMDDIMVSEQGASISQIVSEHGPDYLLALETACVAKLRLYESVLVTPGSIIYDTPCHEQLQKQTTILWLDVPSRILKERYEKDASKSKSIVGIEKGFDALLAERLPLYASLAHLRIDCASLTPQQIAEKIMQHISDMPQQL